MKFMIFVKSNPTLEKKLETMSDSALKESMAKMNAFNDELKKAGVLKDCDGLRPSREGKRVRFDGRVAQRCRRTFRRRLGRRLLAVGAAQHRGRRRLGQTLPESDARAVRDRDPADLTSCERSRLRALPDASRKRNGDRMQERARSAAPDRELRASMRHSGFVGQGATSQLPQLAEPQHYTGHRGA